MLVYFIGNQNIPTHIKTNILGKLIQVEPVLNLKPNVKDIEEFDWRLTVNYYQKNETNNFSGFPFHRDIAANGEITTILTLESPTLIEFIKPDKIADGFVEGHKSEKPYEASELSNEPPIPILLEPNSLVVLSGTILM